MCPLILMTVAAAVLGERGFWTCHSILWKEPQAANEKQRDSGLELQFPSWRASLFFLLRLVYLRLMAGKCQGNITPVPAEVTEAVEEELEEEWMQRLTEFMGERLRPVSKAGEASTAAEVREAFFQYACVPKKEVGLKLARKGFAEETASLWSGVSRTSKRVYRVRFPDGSVSLARLVATGS